MAGKGSKSPHHERHHGRSYIDWPAMMAEQRRDLVRARSGVAAALEVFERQLLGTILASGRQRLRTAWAALPELYTWDGDVVYQAIVHVARVTGPWGRCYGDYSWTVDEILAISDYSMRDVGRVLDLLDYAMSEAAFIAVLETYATWRTTP